MLFNSVEFLIYLIIAFVAYWTIFRNSLKLQNLFVVSISYLFYGWWDWRFLILIAFTSFISYYSGILIKKYRDKNYGKFFMIANIVINVLILCIFKYFNFFSENLYKLIGAFGYEMDWFTLDVLLPVGISFYTFQALSYSIDVYKNKISPTNDIVSFFAYISFFPQLVAGPIERATNLLPQFLVKRKFDYYNSVIGLRQILLGFFKKIAIADTCSPYVNEVFSSIHSYNASSLAIAAVLFSFQIYGDFSGYSDIARGTAKLFGFELVMNFKLPYLSRDISEFWRRWHISLNSWFRDYIYIPLGGSRNGKLKTIRNTIIIFLVSGLWHGASWNFILWGAYHALLFIPLLIANRNRTNLDIVAENQLFPSLIDIIKITFTYTLVTIGWVLFRINNLSDFYLFFERLFTTPFIAKPIINGNPLIIVEPLIYIFILIIIEWIYRKETFSFEKVSGNIILRWSVYIIISIITILSFVPNREFIYFQF